MKRNMQTQFVTLSYVLFIEPGKLMTKYYLKFDTMKHIMQTPVNCSLEDVLHIICRAEEIACMYINVMPMYPVILEKPIEEVIWVIYWNMKGYSSDAMRRNF